jgi:DNA-binding NtrC family response regulator
LERTVDVAEELPSSDVKATILIVEDEALLRMLLSEYLQECGYAVLEACNVTEAMRFIEPRHVKIDLILSDVRMPGEMNGEDLYKWVKKNRPGLPIFLASATSSAASMAKELCADDRFFTKPYDLDQIAVHVREIVAAHKSAN